MWGFQMLLGHLVGDYLLQNDYLALNKSKNSLLGWFTATLHCIIYTLSICLFMENFDLIWMVTVFFSHFFIDKFSLAEVYRGFVGKTTFKKFLSGRDMTRPNIIEGSFTTLIYIVTDNTMHLVLMYVSYLLIYL